MVFTCRGSDRLPRAHSGLDAGAGHLMLLDTPLTSLESLLLLSPRLLGLLGPLLLPPLPPLLPPSLDLGVVVRISPTALTVKVVHKDLLLLLNDLDVIILVLQALY